jgi:glycosyltransferase involved in cell wall biosynthesis
MISLVVISKDERALDATLAALRIQATQAPVPCEILVVDASEGRLDDIRKRHEPAVRWIQFDRPAGAAVTIPHQRNVGVRAAGGDIIAFTDSGCTPDDDWLARLTRPLRDGEMVAAGRTLATAKKGGIYDGGAAAPSGGTGDGYLRECPTINMAFHRVAFDAVGGFDETFAYGSDIDFSWRLVDAGFRIRAVPDAVIRHDWGTWRRQLRRSYAYGKARGRLYRKHKPRRRRVLRDDPMVVVYPLFLLGLPLTLVFPLYPGLLLIPAWRNRSVGAIRVLVDHLAYGAGVLAEFAGR